MRGGVAEWPRPPGGRALCSRIRVHARPMAAGLSDPSRARSALSVQQALKRRFNKIEGMLRRLDILSILHYSATTNHSMSYSVFSIPTNQSSMAACK